ncbi:MAG: acyl-[acyl-carrier-protein] thioesterase [Lachnospiraceae bacterium]|nr:acyl-[acyl-carrier-protein] thioesterase [Lachnospiraceae bacterium]
MYSFDSRIRYSEVDSQGKITLTAILDYFQDCSTFHSEDLGVGLSYLAKEKVVWVLSSWQIEVKRYPEFGELVTVGTWPYGFQSFFGYRNFTLESDKGELLAYANSVWVLLDLKKGRPAKLSPKMLEVYQLSPQLPMECESRKILLPQQMEKLESFPVHKYHIDTNQHVNNGKYVSMAWEYLPRGFQIGKMRAEYRKAAVYGDRIYPFVASMEDKVTVNLADEGGRPYAIVELEEMK